MTSSFVVMRGSPTRPPAPAPAPRTRRAARCARARPPWSEEARPALLAPLPRLDAGAAAVALDEVAHHGEADAAPGDGRLHVALQTEERGPHALRIAGRDAEPLVLHLETHEVSAHGE